MYTKNRLYMSTTYLCGAMDRVPDGGIQWREDLIPWLNSRGIRVLNPINKPCDIGKEDAYSRKIRHEAKMNGDYSLLLKDRDVRSVDLRCVDISDFLIVNLDLTQSPCGTYEELFLANREKKPILVRMEQGKDFVPDWLVWVLPTEMIFSTWDEVKNYLDNIAFSPLENIDRLKRWIFFDYDKITNPALEGWNKFQSGSK